MRGRLRSPEPLALAPNIPAVQNAVPPKLGRMASEKHAWALCNVMFVAAADIASLSMV